VPLPPEVVEPVTREILGVPVPTFAVGTQCHIEKLVGSGKYPTEKTIRAAKVFAKFVDKVKASGADGEFLAPS